MIFKLPQQKEKAISYIERIDKNRLCEVRKDKRNRSTVQNAYYWFLLTMLEQDTGSDKDDLHEYFKSRHLRVDTTFILPTLSKDLPNNVFMAYTKSTTKLTTLEFEVYLEKIRVFASRELGCFLPLPNETIHDYLCLKG